MAGRERYPGTGALPALVAHSVKRATDAGAIEAISTECEYVEDQGVHFVVRRVSNLARKAVARRLQRQRERSAKRPENPFLPYDERLFVCNLSPTHLCLLNKYNVVDHHLLLVTREFREQREPLGGDDFEALAFCLEALDGLGFYNAGREAGASQRHKHLQLVSLPLAPEGPPVPLEARLPSQSGDGAASVDGLPFRHAFVRLAAAGPKALEDAYLELLEWLSVDAAAQPYNLLATRRWMLLVPRSRERFQTISVNTLGFAGSLLVKNGQELERVREVGPMRILREVAQPRTETARG